MRSRFGSKGAILVGLLLATSCAQAPPPDAALRTVTTDLSFGVPDPQTLVPLPDTFAPAAPTAAAPATTPMPPALPTLPPPRPAPGAPRERCPQAGPHVFPREEVPTSPQGFPKEGHYMWRIQGDERFEHLRIGLPEFRTRSVEQVRVEMDPTEQRQTSVEFVTRQPEASNFSATIVYSRFQTNNSGVRLTSIEREEQDGQVRRFAPLSPIVYLPTPVVVGPENRFTSRGVDPISQPGSPQVLEHSGYVYGRHRVDACGEPLDAWLVKAEQTFQTVGPSGQELSVTRLFDYAVATQLGGLIIYERVETPCPGRSEDNEDECTEEADLRFRAHIGQLEPTRR